MANLPNNPHADYARDLLREANGAESYDELVAHAHVEATLAVAFELRTANLIAINGKDIGHYDDLAMSNDIRARLGYDGGAA